MRRAALLSLALGATLAVTAVAVGAGAEGRLHRLHLPPPSLAAVGDPSESGVPAAPPAPVVTQPVTTPPITTTTPPPPVAPPVTAAVGCTPAGGGASADDTGTLSDYAIALSSATVAAAPALRFRATNAGGDTHNLSLRDASGTKLCGTPNLTGGQAETFVVTNLPPGTYELYCTIHPVAMHQALTVS